MFADILRAIAGGALLIAATANPAFAHAHLVGSEPRANAVVTPPHEVVMHFSEPLEGVFSGAVVKDGKGATVSGKPTVDPSDKTIMRVPLTAVGAGRYTVKWHALSVDTHKTRGSFGFTVRP